MQLFEKLFTYRWVLFFLGGSIALFLILIGIVSLFIPSQPTPEPTETPTPTFAFPTSSQQQRQTHSPLQQTFPGVTTASEVEQLPNVINQEQINNSQTAYSFSSPIDSRPNEIITQNNVVVFERQLVPEEETATGYALISEFTTTYGQPEKLVKGSKFYGWNITTYIYASRGIAITGNPDTDEVYEISIFQPTTIEDYTQRWGEDLDPDAKPLEENGLEE